MGERRNSTWSIPFSFSPGAALPQALLRSGSTLIWKRTFFIPREESSFQLGSQVGGGLLPLLESCRAGFRARACSSAVTFSGGRIFFLPCLPGISSPRRSFPDRPGRRPESGPYFFFSLVNLVQPGFDRLQPLGVEMDLFPVGPEGGSHVLGLKEDGLSTEAARGRQGGVHLDPFPQPLEGGFQALHCGPALPIQSLRPEVSDGMELLGMDQTGTVRQRSSSSSPTVRAGAGRSPRLKGQKFHPLGPLFLPGRLGILPARRPFSSSGQRPPGTGSAGPGVLRSGPGCRCAGAGPGNAGAHAAHRCGSAPRPALRVCAG